ncbi:MAG: 16S rRNA (cytidine(1402)-2'-O)-methyltransferase, partial [Acidimicrobiaceae bacterium]|nr:16S rRNA (cytidine(1402)-2'-O)-methyltransferase [Acidimicrobiaceae bacterium]
MTDRGEIVVVGTPIGNLGDLSPRAAAALAEADVICCEDTRHTRKLLSAAGIPAPRLVAMHQHNEAAAAADAVRLAAGGSTVAVATDAGMPGISDPGGRVIAQALEAGVPVRVVPGPSAALAALVASGLPAERFCFEGFLPRKGGDRAARLAAVASETRTTVVFESPRRAAATLADLAAVCGGDRLAAVGRELTKLHEEVRRGTLSELAAWAAAEQPPGEWVIVVSGAATPAAGDDDIREALR